MPPGHRSEPEAVLSHAELGRRVGCWAGGIKDSGKLSKDRSQYPLGKILIHKSVLSNSSPSTLSECVYGAFVVTLDLRAQRQASCFLFPHGVCHQVEVLRCGVTWTGQCLPLPFPSVSDRADEKQRGTCNCAPVLILMQTMVGIFSSSFLQLDKPNNDV